MNWDKLIEKMMDIDPKVAVRLAILDRQMDGGRLSPKQIQSAIDETDKLAESMLRDFSPPRSGAPAATSFGGGWPVIVDAFSGPGLSPSKKSEPPPADPPRISMTS